METATKLNREEQCTNFVRYLSSKCKFRIELAEFFLFWLWTGKKKFSSPPQFPIIHDDCCLKSDRNPLCKCMQGYLLHFRRVFALFFVCLLSSRIVTFYENSARQSCLDFLHAKREMDECLTTEECGSRMIIVDLISKCNRKILCKFRSGQLRMSKTISHPFSARAIFRLHHLCKSAIARSPPTFPH